MNTTTFLQALALTLVVEMPIYVALLLVANGCSIAAGIFVFTR